MFIEITNAKHIRDYRILIEFNNGERKQVDLKDELEAEVFQPLRNKEVFKRFSINFNTIEWENGADLAPEYLYEIGQPVDESVMEHFC
ncbi:MAG: DUF2442 domain-containing protein [Bacteroidales bacterium]|nr:DUF2442 domain-containing protein [Bacteroidales bacterium]